MIPLPTPPKTTKRQKNIAVFEVEGLYPGYGVTIGNTLRRVLLSSLTGATITQVKIEGVPHEFSTIPGVLEDVISILLNLKKLRFRLWGDEEQAITLDVKGEREVKGKDFKLPSNVEIANPDLHIATLTDNKAKLRLEAKVSRGIGYRPIEEDSEVKAPVGVIFLDAVFTPVRKVSFNVENMRVGKRTDFDRLKMEIETDGTIIPEQAWVQASEILQEHYALFAQAFKEEVTKAESKKEEETKEKEKKEKGKAAEKKEEKQKIADVKGIRIEELEIPAGTKKILLENNIKTVAGILAKKPQTLLRLKGMGEKRLEELQKELKKLGVTYTL